MRLWSDEIDALLSADAQRAIRAAPGFRQAAERVASAALRFDDAQDELTQWVLKDLGRTSLYIAAMIIEATLGRVTVYDLMTAAAVNGTCSRGRVLAFINHQKASGRLEVERGEGHWTKRRIALSPAYYTYAKVRLFLELECIAPIVPEAALALKHREDARALTAALVAAGQATVLRRDLFFNDAAPVVTFMNRDAGARLIYDWMSRQAPGRERMLEDVELARSALARRHRISRPHLNQLLADAEAAGLLSLPSPDRIVFAPRLSEDLERHFAFAFQLHKLNSIAIVEACASSAQALDRRA